MCRLMCVIIRYFVKLNNSNLLLFDTKIRLKHTTVDSNKSTFQHHKCLHTLITEL